MSSKERLAAVLESILDRLDAIERKPDHAAESNALLQELKTIAVDMRADLDTLRGRQIEQASRDGEVLHRHQRALQEQDARLTKLEARAAAT